MIQLAKKDIGFRIFSLITSCILASASCPATATEPPRPGVSWPTGDLADRLRNFTTNREYSRLAQQATRNRAQLAAGLVSFFQVSQTGGTLIKGKKYIPVLLMKFADTPNDPFNRAQLQQELFDGPWPSGTMNDYYNEISYGALQVKGTVYPWSTVSGTTSYYAGIPFKDPQDNTVTKPCNGFCPTNHLGVLLTKTLDMANKTIDFSQYDNDGPDGVPNSGDDDGYVDFVAFVQPGRGGECGSDSPGKLNNNIWSHRFRLSDLTGHDYETKDLDKNGRRIRIDDYVIMPALDCSGKKMIEIGGLRT